MNKRKKSPEEKEYHATLFAIAFIIIVLLYLIFQLERGIGTLPF